MKHVVYTVNGLRREDTLRVAGRQATNADIADWLNSKYKGQSIVVKHIWNM